MFHTPGWVGDLDTLDSPMDKAFDPKVAEGLTAAWRARATLGLGARARGAGSSQAVDAVARGPFFRFPYVRLNQINWNAELYAYAATLTGNPELLRRRLPPPRAPLRRGRAPPAARGLGAQPVPELPLPVPDDLRRLAQEPGLGGVREHDAALHRLVRAGAARRDAPAARRPTCAILRAWAARVQFGYWMHNGMLSWDSGLGFKRWMKAKTWAYAQQGLLAIASSPRFWLRPAPGRVGQVRASTAGCGSSRSAASRCRRATCPSVHLYDVGSAYQGTGSRRIYVARMGANAMRALVARARRTWTAERAAAVLLLRRRRRPAEREHAALLRGDPRPTTTARSPTAGSSSRGSSTPQGVPVGGVGGRPPAASGVVLRRPGRRRVLATQGAPRDAKLVLDRSPRGRVSRTRRLPRVTRTPGPFGALEAVGRVAGGGARGHRAPPLHRRVRREHLDRDARAPAAARRGAVPELGRRRGARSSPCSPTGRRLELPGRGRGRRRPRSATSTSPGPRGGYVLVLSGGGRATRAARRAPAVGAAPRADAGGRDAAALELRARIAPAARRGARPWRAARPTSRSSPARRVLQRLEAQRVHVVGLLAQHPRPAAHGGGRSNDELVGGERAVAADRHPAVPTSIVSQRIGVPLRRCSVQRPRLGARRPRRVVTPGIVLVARAGRASATCRLTLIMTIGSRMIVADACDRLLAAGGRWPCHLRRAHHDRSGGRRGAHVADAAAGMPPISRWRAGRQDRAADVRSRRPSPGRHSVGCVADRAAGRHARRAHRPPWTAG